jgi:hypothetical protein
MKYGKKPWQRDPKVLENICQLIVKNNVTSYNDFELSWIGVWPYKQNGQKLSNKDKLTLIFGRARKYLKDKNIPVTSQSLAFSVRKIEIKYNTPATRAHKKNFIHIDENVYTVDIPLLTDDSGPCKCTANDKCGPSTNCLNRYVAA